MNKMNKNLGMKAIMDSHADVICVMTSDSPSVTTP